MTCIPDMPPDLVGYVYLTALASLVVLCAYGYLRGVCR